MAQHNDLGHTGEEIAAEYLTRKSYEILAMRVGVTVTKR